MFVPSSRKITCRRSRPIPHSSSISSNIFCTASAVWEPDIFRTQSTYFRRDQSDEMKCAVKLKINKYFQNIIKVNKLPNHRYAWSAVGPNITCERYPRLQIEFAAIRLLHSSIHIRQSFSAIVCFLLKKQNMLFCNQKSRHTFQIWFSNCASK